MIVLVYYSQPCVIFNSIVYKMTKVVEGSSQGIKVRRVLSAQGLRWGMTNDKDKEKACPREPQIWISFLSLETGASFSSRPYINVVVPQVVIVTCRRWGQSGDRYRLGATNKIDKNRALVNYKLVHKFN